MNPFTSTTNRRGRVPSTFTGSTSVLLLDVLGTNTSGVGTRLHESTDTAVPVHLPEGETIKGALGIGTSPTSLLIHTLATKRLRSPLSVLLERDGDGFLAQTVDLPLYAWAETPQLAVAGLQTEVEQVYLELLEDDDFSLDWLNRKRLLRTIVED